MKIRVRNPMKRILPAYRPHVKDYSTRIMVFYGGAGSGKSYFVCQKMALKAMTMGDRKMLFIRKVGNTLKGSIWDLMLEILDEKVIKEKNKSEMTITLVNGSVLLFKCLDDPEKIKSINGITDIIIEEATELTLDDFTQLKLRLRSKKPYNQIHMMFNPVSKANWVYKEFFQDGCPENAIVVRTTYKDNPNLPEEYISSILALQNSNPAYFKIYVLGEFATLDKLVFPIIEKRLISEEEVKGKKFWCGLDFGYTNDPTAITWGYFDKPSWTLWITGEYDRTGMTNDVIAETIKTLGLSKEVIVADSAEPKSISEIKKMGIVRMKESKKGPDSVKNGLDRMSRCKIIVDERCPHTIEEFENYTWKKDKKTNEYINEPIDMFNHHIDSIRYGIQSTTGGMEILR